ncbi:hypothetical protein K9U40_20135 [Xanthobacter autotrophicus]|uniref:hypothetical protein n=1 Tax=Xanthobacter TaxID=279 RepID=UPI0024AB118B|nr:hypothetical protein [Xanthobacter autotrophicus]MDI4666612.1 hypothetical protein [Xanthobacter autotrophicus]
MLQHFRLDENSRPAGGVDCRILEERGADDPAGNTIVCCLYVSDRGGEYRSNVAFDSGTSGI